MNTVKELLDEKKKRFIENTPFIKDLFNFMLDQKLVPIHPAVSAGQTKNYWKKGQFEISLFKTPGLHNPKYKNVTKYGLRIENSTDDNLYPIAYFYILKIEHKDDSKETQLMIDDAMKSEHQVFNPGNWMEIVQHDIIKQKETSKKKEHNAELKVVQHYQKILRIT